MGGFSALISGLAVLGFITFVAGIALAVIALSQGRPARGGVALIVLGLIAGVVFTIIGQGLIFVEPNQRAVVFNTATNELTTRGSGISVVTPAITTVTLYNVGQQEYTMSATNDEGSRSGDDAVDAQTRDGQQVDVDVTVFYNINPEDASLRNFHQRWLGQDYTAYIRSQTRTALRNVIGRFTAQALYGEERGEIQQQVFDELSEDLGREGLQLNTVDLRGLTFSETFIEAVEDVQAAEQNVAQAEAEANAVIARAEGERQAAIARAQGEAEAIRIRAQAEAEALRVVSQQIAANPALIQYLYVQNLSDNVGLVLVPANSPFLFDMASLAEANGDFTAPAVPTPEPTPGS